ncbi:MAG: SMC-Scp complex subunit ScpB [Cyanobacteria bacterium P01_D01_bin.105]
MSRLANTLEAILYLKAQPLKIAQLAELARCDKETAEEGLIELMGQYAHRDGALEIAETEEGYALQLREVYKPLVDSIVPLDIGLGALRTLAAIALRGPIAQSELVELRGSGVYQHVPDLVAQGFVKKRRQSDGRSSWVQITEKFYQHFEIDKLPEISNLRLPKPIDETPIDGTATIDETGAEETHAVEKSPATEDSNQETADTNQVDTGQVDTHPADTELEDGHAESVDIQPQEMTTDTPTEEVAVLSGTKPPSGGTLLSDEAIEKAAQMQQHPDNPLAEEEVQAAEDVQADSD